jgi:hypothetical protein
MAMSRIALVIVMFGITPAHAAQTDDPVAQYRQMTSVAVRCAGPKTGNTITVCGRRAADRWRVPFVAKTPGDPETATLSQERNALISTSTPCQQRGPFLIGCGSGVGVSAGVGIGPGAGGLKVRPLAD